MNRTWLVDTGREVVVTLRREQLGFLAAAIAYYAFLATVPLLIVAFAVASAIGGEAFAESVLAAVQGVLSEEAAAVTDSSLTSGPGRSGATLVGLLVLTWSGLRLFRGLDHAFDRIYAAQTASPLLKQLTDASAALGAIGLAVVGTGALAWALPVAQLPFFGLIGPLLGAFVLTLVFVPLYYVLPDRDLGPLGVLPGAALAGGGWTLLGTLFSLYAGLAGGFLVYGVLGGVLLLLTWLYFGALLLLAGAVLNVALVDGAGNRQLQQDSPAGGG
jgi:membrane protein